MKTLMHICCAPCANQPIEVLRTDGIEVAGFWYNPNIHPVTEYRALRNCLEDYAKQIELPLIMKNDYALRPFVREVAEDIASYGSDFSIAGMNVFGCVISGEYYNDNFYDNLSVKKNYYFMMRMRHFMQWQKIQKRSKTFAKMLLEKIFLRMDSVM